jgi:hypothetical protein
MTKRSILKLFGLMGMMALAACDVTQTTELVAPQAADLAVTDYRWTPVLSSSATTTTTTVAVVGRNGGTITNGANTLVVPSYAVLEDTEFTFTMVGDGTLHTALTARSVATGLPVTTFARSLMLRMSYANATVADPSQLVIAWMIDGTADGLKQKQTSWVTTYTKMVNAYLNHFSDYCVCTGLE